VDVYFRSKEMNELFFHYVGFCFLTFDWQDIAGTLATEEAEDAAQVAKLRSALESVDHKRRKVCVYFFFSNS